MGAKGVIFMVMLNSQISTPSRWFLQVDENLNEILIDHAHCEKKAAGVAMNLLFAYVDSTKFLEPWPK